LHAWAVLSRQKQRDAFLQHKYKLVKQFLSVQHAANAIRENVELFEDFESNSYEEWYPSGQAFGTQSAQTCDFRFRKDLAHPVAELVSKGTAHSGIVSGKLQGALRSKTFTITKSFIYYRVRRREGQANPGRQNKNGQVNLIIDGFQLIKNPLYGGLSINIPLGESFRWYRQDVRKFKNSKAYIEILDEDDGFIEVDTILFSDSAAVPPEEPNRLITRMLDDPALDSLEQLAKKYEQLLVESVELWRQGKLSSSEISSDRIEIINWLLKHELLFDSIPLSVHNRQKVRDVRQRFEIMESRIYPPQKVLAIADGTGENERLLIRGNHQKPGPDVPRRYLEVFAGPKQRLPNSGSGRLDLARHVVDPSNPLTARVIVNRLWLHHFGRGIVPTPDNFGKLGQPPSHPELLDFLASELMQNGWSLKRMHRMMVLSSTYRMSSRPSDSEAERIDPEIVLLHRMRIRRLEGEVIRDAILAGSSRLDRKMTGPSVLPFLTSFMEGRGRPKNSGPLDGEGRRSLYINVRRNFLTPMFLSFDYPTPLTTMGRRSVSNVPAQALTMMNNPFVVQQAYVWAERVLSEPGKTPKQRIRRIYETAFCRLPTDSELAAALQFLSDQGQEYNGPDDPRTWADYCHVLMNVKEFVFLE
jgi:hypothetical protein